MPPINAQRRAVLADAAIELLAEAGVHGVTHRAVERRAELPAGTTSNYFRSREALLVAVVERVVDLHLAGVDAATTAGGGPRGRGAGDVEHLTDLLTASLLTAATTHRQRYLAIFELRIEALRRPALAGALDELVRRATGATAAHHAALGLPVPPERVASLLQLYGGALFTLVSGPAEAVTAAGVRPLAAALARGALGPAAQEPDVV